MMIQLLKGYWRGFIGGPDFNNQHTLHFILEDQQLSINLPQTNVVSVEPPRPVNFPYKSKDWFDSHKKQQQHNSWVHINTMLWMYLPVISFSPGSEYGMLSCSLWVKRIPATANITPYNREELARFVIDEYDNFHNGEIDESLGAGINTQIKKDFEKQSAAMASPFTGDDFIKYLNMDIASRGHPPIPPARIVSFNNIQWVFYQEVRTNSLSRKDYYCLPLDEQHYLVCRFNHRVSLSNKHKKWRDHALASQLQIMNSITLTPVEKTSATSGNLLESNATQAQ
ncbi:hypothetical protein SG34_014215 [Thalassomonas viridans]|uniref:Uncharacterized protein n=1 Tax=Thalassomonas viridans TaxID=137584 RepID=A0AAF0CC94_9GAMM|nr:hypothetical protein [Thalassomonas viridans]WDE07936.1 hypothetical protein SG34_014215 [Thalassomonas viridans]